MQAHLFFSGSLLVLGQLTKHWPKTKIVNKSKSEPNLSTYIPKMIELNLFGPALQLILFENSEEDTFI